MAPGHHLLNATIADAAWIDVLRLIVIGVGGAVFGTGLMRLVMRRMYYWTLKRASGFVAIIIAALFASVQEYDQLNLPMVWWRLPLLVVFVVFAGLFVFLPERPKDRDWRMQVDERRKS